MDIIRRRIFSTVDPPSEIAENSKNTLNGCMSTDGFCGTPAKGITFMSNPMGSPLEVDGSTFVHPWYSNHDPYAVGDVALVEGDASVGDGFRYTPWVAGTGYNLGTDWCPYSIQVDGGGFEETFQDPVYRIMPARTVLVVRVSGKWANATTGGTGFPTLGWSTVNLGGVSSMSVVGGAGGNFTVRCNDGLKIQKLQVTGNLTSQGNWQIEMQFLYDKSVNAQCLFRFGISGLTAAPGNTAGLAYFQVAYHWLSPHNGIA